MIRHFAFLFLAVLLLAASSTRAADVPKETLLLRFPDIHEDRVVFSYGGDLWIAPVRESELVSARRLTSHPGLELFPRFSPDGKWIAFTGQYDGDEQVYVVPADGGEPRQLTYYPARGPLPPRWGYDHQVHGWTPDGSAVLFRSMREGWALTGTRLYTVSIDGGLPRALPMTVAGAGDLSPDGKRVVYSPLTRDFRTWKRYQGGWAQDLWIFDIESGSARQLTTHPRTERDPMWIGDRIWFASDRTGTLNLWSCDPSGGTPEQATFSKEWDVRWPGASPDGRIVYELGGRLHVFDTRTRADLPLSIWVPDDGVARRPSSIRVEGNIESFGLGPTGTRALFVARGEVFTVPTEHGAVRNLTRSPGAHDREAAWSPDGEHVAFLSDADGEEEIWIARADGSEKPRQLTDGGSERRHGLLWAPGARRIAFGDKSGRILVADVESGEVVLVADNPTGATSDYAWSPDGRWLAFSLAEENENSSLWIWSAEDATLHRVTDERFNEHSPAWSRDGKYLFYLSDREFAPQISSIEWNFAVDRETAVFVLALRRDVEHPFPPKSDEEKSPNDSASDPSKAGEREKESHEGDSSAEDADDSATDEKESASPDGKSPRVDIDFDGLAQRVARVPAPADNYRQGSLQAVDGHLLWVRSGARYYGRETDRPPALSIFSLEKREERTLIEDVGGFALSENGKKLLARRGGRFELFDVAFEGKPAGKALSLELRADRVPGEEWAALFDEVWRRFRDYFYVPNMHGYDWEALRDRYRPLLEHVAHRSDLNYVLGEMVSELNVSHAYITGGDWIVPERAPVGLLGARLELDDAAGRYRIAEILRGENEEARYRSPLTEIGVNVEEGEYLLAIDHIELGPQENPYRVLRHRADRPVILTVNREPTFEGARDVTVLPITSEVELRYLAWVTKNRESVASSTGGKVGYIHIPDMSADGIREFIKGYYGQIRKEGLIVDVRNNGGGNVSQMIIERLRRRLLGTRFARNIDFAETYPDRTFHGHMVCVLNENSASDGDIFPHMFRQAGLGPLIGKRSWGGVIGITSHGPLIDGGSVNVPEFGTNGADGSWILEGHGVDPDIEVDNDPASLHRGEDPQLARAIEEVLRRMEEEPRKLPPRPEPPIKTE